MVHCWMRLTIRVDNGQNVKVVLVKQSLDSGIILLVAINELVGEVFDNLSQISNMNHIDIKFGQCTMVVIHSRAWTVPCQ